MRIRARASVRPVAVCLLVAATLFMVSACGGSSHSGTSSPSSTSTSGSPAAATPSGAGYDQPTAPSGARIKGGTVTFSEGADAPPNYIFPMTTAQVCSTSNTDQLSDMLVRPLYWFGNDDSPTVDDDYSVADKPLFTDGDRTVTIHIKPWKWSDGETVGARDVELWINLYRANPRGNYCGFVPGYIPQNITHVSAPNAQTLVLHLNHAYDPEWFTYNQLSQLQPIPLAWDRTSLSQPAPTNPNAKNLPDLTKAGAEKVYNFLNAQSKKVGSWASSPLWSVVDGPFKLQSYTSAGQVTMVPNPKYSGSPKPTISKLVELPFTSDTAIFNEERSGGPSAVTVGSVPAQDAPQASKLTAQGYIDNQAASYSVNYFPFNLHNPKVGPVFSQLYFRQAFAHLVDQTGWTDAYLARTAVPTYGPIPAAPKSPLVSAGSSANPYPFSISAAAALLKDNGWTVKPGGATTCTKPGTGSGECGAGIRAGEGISFNLDYESGVEAVQSEMENLQADAKKVGITLQLTNHPFSDVIGKAIACSSTASSCGWTAENWGAGWIYSPDYLPTGEELYGKGASANYGSYSTPESQKLIDATVYGPLSGEKAALTAFANYMEKQAPVVYGPTSIGTFSANAGTLVSSKLGGYAANAFGYMTPEQWYLTK